MLSSKNGHEDKLIELHNRLIDSMVGVIEHQKENHGSVEEESHNNLICNDLI